MRILAIVVGVLIAVCLALQTLRWTDLRRASHAWRALAARSNEATATFDVAMVEALPEPARRFFLFTIRPGAPLRTVAEIEMGGELGLGTREKPDYAPMRARQILAPPYGLVWRVTSGAISGSDGLDEQGSWTRFWLLYLLPVVRASGVDHARSAFGRVVAESVFWTPAALLPQNGVRWEAVDENSARASVSFNGLTQSVDVSVDQDGRPGMVVIPRWSNANPEKVFRLQPFGGFLSEFREFDGYVLPTHVEGGNFVGSEDYFPFYRARVQALRFVGQDGARSRAREP